MNRELLSIAPWRACQPASRTTPDRRSRRPLPPPGYQTPDAAVHRPSPVRFLTPSRRVEYLQRLRRPNSANSGARSIPASGSIAAASPGRPPEPRRSFGQWSASHELRVDGDHLTAREPAAKCREFSGSVIKADAARLQPQSSHRQSLGELARRGGARVPANLTRLVVHALYQPPRSSRTRTPRGDFHASLSHAHLRRLAPRRRRRGRSACPAGCTASATTATCCSSICATTTASPSASSIRRHPAFAEAAAARPESVVTVTGKVVGRTPETVNPALPTGEVEVRIELRRRGRRPRCCRSRSPSTPTTDEERRLRYRFLDLRRERMHATSCCVRSVIASMRQRMIEQGFN